MSYVVADTGPLIALAKLNLIELPQRAFGKVLLPQCVFDECQYQIRRRDAALIGTAVKEGWLEVVPDVPWPEGVREPRLDAGERAAIAMAIHLQGGLLIDETRGRREAIRLGIKVVGACGLLVLAKREGWISNIAPLLDQLQREGYFIAPILRESILRQCGEV